jgi:hypothetical protein
MLEVVMQQHDGQEPVPRWRVPLAVILGVQVMAGVVLGAVTGYLGTSLGGRLVVADPAGFGDIVAMLGGLLLGFPLGVSGGVWASGRLLGGQGAVWATLLGAYLGVGIGIVGVRLLIYSSATAGWLLVIVLSLLGACAGYHLRRPGSQYARGE